MLTAWYFAVMILQGATHGPFYSAEQCNTIRSMWVARWTTEADLLIPCWASHEPTITPGSTIPPPVGPAPIPVPPPITGALVATLLPSLLEVDRVEPLAERPSGVPDVRVQLDGLNGVPVKIRVAGNPGVWERPYNQVNWVIALIMLGPTSAEIMFEPLPEHVGSYTVSVTYADGTVGTAMTR